MVITSPVWLNFINILQANIKKKIASKILGWRKKQWE